MNQKINLKIKNYNGPLDILFFLIKSKKMDIFNIDLSEIANEYLNYINKIKKINIDLASEYLVMATTLIQIKANILVENKKNVKEIENQKEKLLKQLLEYQQFKEISKNLRKKEILRQNIFIKNQENLKLFKKKQNKSYLYGNLNLFTLVLQIRKMFERIKLEKLNQTIIEKLNLSPKERRLELLEIIKNNDNLTFEIIFSVPTIEHFSLTLLTILDMCRKQELIIKQNEQFGEIKFKKGMI
jgi:segregation and condensation protein A